MPLSSAASSVLLPAEGASPRDAVASAFERCADSLYRYFAVRVAGDGHLASDLMQQLWIQADRGARHVPEHELEFWLRGVATNLIRTHWRARKRRPPPSSLGDPALAGELAERLASEDLPIDVLQRREVRDQLLLALTSLAASEQDLIVGHYFEGRSFADLAGAHGLTPRAIEGRLYRARSALRERLRHLE